MPRPRAVVLMLAAFVALAGCRGGPAVTASTATASPGPTPAPSSGPSPGARPAGTSAVPPGWHVSSRSAAGPVLETTVHGPLSGVTGKVWVWLPPEYDQPAYEHSAFPVVVFHTGGSGVGENYWDDPHVVPTQRVDEELAAEHRAHPFIMVMPVLQLSVAQDTECSDHAVVSWGGYFDPEPDQGVPWTSEQMAANSPTRMLQAGHPDLRILLLAGDDPQFRSDQVRLQEFARLAAPRTSVSTYIQPGGRHYTADLAKLLPRILTFLSDALEGPSSL